MEKERLLIDHPPASYGSEGSINSPPTTPQHTIRSGATHTQDLTPDDILNKLGIGLFQIIALLLAGLTYFSYAVDSSIFVFLSFSVNKEYNVTTTEYTVLPATTGIANMFGSFFFSYSTDRFGRVWPYALCLIWIGLASIASAFANTFPLLVVLRLLASLGIGGVTGLTFPTLVEFLPVKNRGKMSVSVLLVGSIGLSVSTGLAWWLIPTYELGWRYYIAICGAPMILIGFFRLVFYFESPRYLITRGKHLRAWKIFRTIAKFNCTSLENYFTFEEFQRSVQSQAKQTKKQKFILLQLLEIFMPKYLRRTIPLSFITITESIGFLSSQLFLPEFADKVNVNKYFIVLVSAVAQIPGILLMSIIIEWPKVGRLNSLRLFSLLSSLFFMLLAIVQNQISIPVLVIFVYFSSYPNLSLLYTYISEVYPTEIRSVTIAYFYTLQALSYLVGAFISNAASGVNIQWLFPSVFSIVFLIQFLVGLILNYEPLNRNLLDVL